MSGRLDPRALWADGAAGVDLFSTERWAALQGTIAGTLLALGAIVAFFNWIGLAVTLRTGRNVSPILLVGSIALGSGAVLTPVLRPFAWAIVLLDYGTVVLLLALPVIARDVWQTSRVNLLEEFVGRRGGVTVRLRLFRRGVCTLRWAVPLEKYGFEMSMVGAWVREAGTLVLRFGENRAVFRPLPEGVGKGWRQSVGIDAYERRPELSLDGVDFVPRA